MRLGILTQYYPPEMGAPQARLHELARLFVAAGHEVSVLTAMPSYPLGRVFAGYNGVYKRELLDGVTVHRAWAYPTQSVKLAPRLGSYLSFVGASASAGALVLPRVDYLLTESPPLFLGLSGVALARIKRARLIFNVSDLWPESAVRLSLLAPGPALSAAERLEAFCYAQSWMVTGQSREILGDIERRFAGVDTYHLSNGVDTRTFLPSLRSNAMRRMLSASPDDCIALYAGLHGVAQGLEQILDAAATLRDERLSFAFVGDGAKKEQLMARSRALGLARVRFIDVQPKPLMAELVASADVALVPLGARLPGAVPSKIYESMSAGLPVMLVAEGEAAAIVAQAEAGISVAPGDAVGLVAGLRALAADPARRREMGARGRAAAVARYDRRLIGARFIEYLEARLATPAARARA